MFYYNINWNRVGFGVFIEVDYYLKINIGPLELTWLFKEVKK